MRGSTGGLDAVEEQKEVGDWPSSTVARTERELVLSRSDQEGSTPRQDEEKLLRRKYQLEKELQ